MARIDLDVYVKLEHAHEGLEQLKSQFRSLGEEFSKIKVDKDFATNIKALTDHYKKLGEAAKAVAKDTEQYKIMEQKLLTEQEKTKKLQEEIADIRKNRETKAIKDQMAAEEKLLKQQEQAEKKLLRLEAQYARMILQVEKFKEAGKGEEEQLNRITEELRENWELLQQYNETQKGGVEEADEFEKILLQLRAAFDTLKVEIHDNDEEIVTWSDRLKEAQEQIDKVFGNAAIRLWRTWFSEVKKILDDTNEVLTRTENTVIELQRVLNDNVSDRQISNALYQLAQQYGQTFENASIIAENFAKSGMSWNDTIKATESALLAMNVAELNASESSEGLLSIMVQFKKDASELETIVDQLNKTADKNPVTTEKLLKALQRTGSAAATSNLSLEKTISIITTLSAATNRSGQNIGTATNALIMYTQKNLDTFAAMSEESAKVVENFKHGTADVVDIWRAAQDEIEKLKKERGDLVSLTDLFGGTEGMEELNSSLHDELDDVFEQISSVYDIANTYRKNYFIALLDNLDRFDSTLKGLEDTQDYSRQENEKYMSTYEAKLNSFTSKWQYLANDEQGLLKFRKGLLDIGGVILDVIKHTGGISNAILTISGQVGGLLLMVKSASIVKKLREAKDAMVLFGKAVKGVADEGKAAEASFGWISVAVAAISLIVGVVNGITTSIKNANQALIDAADATRTTGLEIKDQFDKLNALDEKSDEYYEIEDKIVSLLGDKAKVLENLTKGTDGYTEALKRLTKQEIADEINRQKDALNAIDLFENFGADQWRLFAGYNLDPEEYRWDKNKQKADYIEAYKQAAEALKILNKEIEDAEAAGADAIVASKETERQELSKTLAVIEETFDKYILIEETIDDLRASYKSFDETVEEVNTHTTGTTLPNLGTITNSIQALNGQIDQVQSSLKIFEEAQKELDETGEISIDTLQSILELGSEYIDVLEEQDGRLVINKEKLDLLIQSKEEHLNQLVDEQILAYATQRANEIMVMSDNEVAEASANAATGVALLNDALSEGEEQAETTAEKYGTVANKIREIAFSLGTEYSTGHADLFLSDVGSYAEKLRSLLSHTTWTGISSSGSSGSSSSSSGSTKDEYLENLKAIVSLRKSELTLMEHQGKSAEDQIKKMKEIQASLHNQAEYLREIGASETDINSLSSEWWTYQEKILKTYQETLNAAKELELEAIEKVISSIQEEIDLREEELTLSEKQLAVTQAQADLEKAIAQAKLDFISQVLSNYITSLADAATLEEKQRAVVEAKEKYATAQKEAQTKAIVDAMKAQKDLGKDALSLEEKRLAVEEARQALIDAQNDRTTRVFDEATGEWHYEANAQAVKSAQERLADAMKSLDEYLEGEAWDEMLDKMEKGSVSESEMLAIIKKWQDQGYGTTEWSEKLVQAYRFAMGATADPNSVAGELNAVNNATKSLNDYLKNQAVKEIQNMIKNGNTSTAEMQLIMEKWLSMGEGGEIWQWSEGVLNEVRKAIQSNAYDGSKVESSVKAVETATKALADYFQNKFVSDINKLVAAGSAAEIYAALKYWEETGQIPDDLMDWGKRLADEVGIKNKVEEDYKKIENDPSHYGEVKGVVDSGYAASMTSAALAATNPDLTSALTGVAQFGANAASWMNSYGIGYGASDKTPSESFINTRNSTTNDSHNSYTVNGVPFSVDAIRNLTMQELFETLPIVSE